ncbi:MAG: serine/threonine-protein kinase [Verrucomicrobiales bacterium]
MPQAGTGGRRSGPPAIGEIAPHFPGLEILELLGAGGMGAVYKVRQPQLDRTVALKILSHELSREPAFVERFNREAKMLARLSHPNIVAVFDFGTAGPYCYLLMEYVDGVNLRQAMRTGGFNPAETLTLVQDVCSALQFAHEEGILHRDIKPENILVDSKGRVKIADFGIAKLVGSGAPSDVTLTLQGSVLGSPHYMAPEQIETPGDIDQRADIYSLGVVLYEMLTGELPIGRFALPSQKATMDARIDEIVLRTLEKEREARFQSAEEVSTSVGALAQSPLTESPPAPAAKPGEERPAARFSLGSALLTGASLVLSIVSLVAMDLLEPFSMAKPARIAGDNTSMVATVILVILPAILGALTGICGFILGASALAKVRKSRGQKEGLGSAVFAVAADQYRGVRPHFAFPQRSHARVLLGIGWLGSRHALCGLPYLIAVVWFVRALIRWGGGVERSAGERHFPGTGESSLPSALLILARS